MVLIIAFSSSVPFRTSVNQNSLLMRLTPLLFASIGQTIVIVLGGIDLSVGSVISLATVLVASYESIGADPVINVLLTVMAGIVVGAINGLGCNAGINPMIMTLSTMTAAKGLALLVLGSPGGKVSSQLLSIVTTNLGPVPVAFVAALVTLAIAWFTLSETKWGRNTYATGSDPAHAYSTGIRTGRIQLIAYTISGLTAALAGIVMAGRIYSGDPLVGDPVSLDSITAVVLGGIALTGGRGSLIGVLAGVLLLGLLDNVMNMFGIFSYYQYIIKGLILIAALYTYNMSSPQKNGHMPRWLAGIKVVKPRGKETSRG